MAFPLQRLPTLAQHEVVKSMKLEEILVLSICSRRMRFIVKQSVRRQPFTITFQNGFVQKLHCSFSSYIYLDTHQTIWDALKIDISTFRTLEFMSDVFNNPSVQLVFLDKDVNCHNDLQKVEKQGLKLHSVSAQPNHIKFALESCQHAEELHLQMKDSEVFKSTRPLRVYKLNIQSSNVLNINHIIRVVMNITQLRLTTYDCYKVEDIAKFIEAWKTSNSNLRDVEMVCQGSIQTMLEKQSAIPVKAVWMRKGLLPVKGTSLERCTFLEGKCYLIQQRYGVKAIVYKHNDFFVLDTAFRVEQ